jgi:hypothetical protein
MPLSDDQYRAIGRITVQFNYLEVSMNALVWALATPDLNIGRVAFAREPFDRMLRRAKRLGEEEVTRRNRELGTRIQQWATRARDLQERRNAVVHGVWYSTQPTGDMLTLRIGREHIIEPRTSATDLDQLADEILEARQELSEILLAIPPFGER